MCDIYKKLKVEGGRWKVGGGDDGRRQVGAHYFFFFNIIQFKTVSKRQDGLKVKMIWAGSLAPKNPQRTTISASGFDPGDRHQKPPPRGNVRIYPGSPLSSSILLQ